MGASTGVEDVVVVTAGGVWTSVMDAGAGVAAGLAVSSVVDAEMGGVAAVGGTSSPVKTSRFVVGSTIRRALDLCLREPDSRGC